ncbi:alpha/beta hydrolase [Catenulispora sp. NF23]|uniref:Alpha/beta hydrolase n=1 Tax=Catenulispora pinistramenti TaxID=2705254 RepID=A0ABS5KKG2_9ACTN|nr:alpha/beta hydrolase [Catenulispora pinistramenti]MBS2532588.1 alpha/beta hydrolase [Catenulispora pinistramenti]MBS2546304.1 alpha/beta hydrolase [Catenulispora pinistramenti]
MTFTAVDHIATPVLDIAYEHAGDPSGIPVILLHGFPYDVRAYDKVAASLAARGGYSVYAPYLRGFGRTRFQSETYLRSGQQGAIGQDLLDFIDALGLDRPIVAGYDWGGRAACIVSALWPERVRGLVTVDGYNVQDIARSAEPSKPEWEATFWYQYYFHSERGLRGLERHREELCELLWQTWSPKWEAASAEFQASAPSLHNPDFVEVVIHSYRHRYGLAEGDPRYAAVEERLAFGTEIEVPTVVLEAGADGVGGPTFADSGDRELFTGRFEYRLLDGIGHNVPQEAPEAFAEAVDLLGAGAGAGTGAE